MNDVAKQISKVDKNDKIPTCLFSMHILSPLTRTRLKSNSVLDRESNIFASKIIFKTFRTFQDFSKHFKTFENFSRLLKLSLGLQDHFMTAKTFSKFFRTLQDFF